MAEDLRKPKISVIMPLYNGERYLAEAIESILNQTFGDFELLLINDAAKDRTEEIIFEFSDQRIVYIKNEQNLGLIKTLNKGLDLAQGEFVARMDQDDISLPERFEKQIAVFKNNPEVGVCGTWFTIFRNGKESEIAKHPEDPEEIKIRLLSYCALGHPTVMMRASVIKNLRYDNDFKAAEDYEFWTRLSRVTKICNIPAPLLNYRYHETNMSVLDEEIQKENSEKIFENQLTYIGLSDNKNDLKYLRILFREYVKEFSFSDLKNTVLAARKFETANSRADFYYDKSLITKTINDRLFYFFEKMDKKDFRVIPFLFFHRKDVLKRKGMRNSIAMMKRIILKTN